MLKPAVCTVLLAHVKGDLPEYAPRRIQQALKSAYMCLDCARVRGQRSGRLDAGRATPPRCLSFAGNAAKRNREHNCIEALIGEG